MLQLTDEVIDEFETKYGEEKRKNVAFFQLKTVLAPCIESLVLLDRLAFLLGQVLININRNLIL